MRFKKLFFSNIQGVTITEMLIALALISIIALMVSQLTVQQSKNSFEITDSFEVNEFTIRIGESLRNKEACKQTFKDILIPNATTPIVPITLIKNADLTSGAGHDIFNLNSNDAKLSPRVTVNSLDLTAFGHDLTNYTFSADTSGVANLYRLQLDINFTKAGNPPTRMVRTIPLVIKKNNSDPTKIYSCYTEENSWYQQICSTLLTGNYTEQNATVARICADMNIKGSISTDGHFCFNEVDSSSTNSAGNVHRKDCINSWYAGWAKNFGGPSCYSKSPNGGGCNGNDVVVGASAWSCGKECVQSSITCCPVRLRK
jgi:prepilin-type N-terminal cleavage/methylation domain-containing protein